MCVFSPQAPEESEKRSRFDFSLWSASFIVSSVSQRQMIDKPTKVYQAEMPIKQLTGNDEYFDRLGWGELEQVRSRV